MTKAMTITHDNTATRIAQSDSLHDAVKKTVEDYFHTYNNTPNFNLYEKILSEVEAPLFSFLLEHANNNQCEITRWLGLARGTVRKKMKQYGLLNNRKSLKKSK